MARPLRLDHAGGVWHVTSRGNERREILREDEDRERFLKTLAEVVKRFRENSWGQAYGSHISLIGPWSGCVRDCRSEGGFSIARMARFFGREESTLVQAVLRLEKVLKTDGEPQRQVARLAKAIRSL